MTKRQPAVRTGTDTEDLVELIKKRHIPVTRENHLHMAYFGDLPEPSTPEHEAELPVELQDLVAVR